MISVAHFSNWANLNWTYSQYEGMVQSEELLLGYNPVYLKKKMVIMTGHLHIYTIHEYSKRWVYQTDITDFF